MRFDDKLDRIAELITQRTAVNSELAALLGEEAKTLPDGISVEDEVREALCVQESIRVADVKRLIDEKHSIDIPRGKVNTAINSLTKSGVLVKGERGSYTKGESNAISN